jgi:hypothetical protein
VNEELEEVKQRDHMNEEKVEFSTGAKCSVLKGRFDLICPTALKRLAARYALGSEKYDDFNWCKGIPIHVRLNHLETHLQEYKLHGNVGDDNMAAIAWNAFAIMHYEEGCKHHLAPFIEKGRRICDCTDSCKGTCAEAPEPLPVPAEQKKDESNNPFICLNCSGELLPEVDYWTHPDKIHRLCHECFAKIYCPAKEEKGKDL